MKERLFLCTGTNGKEPFRRHATVVESVTMKFSCFTFSCGEVFVQDGNNEIVLGHEAVLGDEDSEAPAQTRFLLKIVKCCSMMEVGVRKYPVHSPADGA